MAQNIRFGDFQRESAVERDVISYNDLSPKAAWDRDGHLVPHVHAKVQLDFKDVYRLLRTYSSSRFMEQLQAVVPLAVYLALFQMIALREMVQDSWMIVGGLFGVIVGLMLFMEGLKLGLMPFGETIGHILPKKSPLPVVLLVAFLLGVGVTFAEPAIGALKTAGQAVSPLKAPILYALLT
ncbi:MAG: DUF1538 family protein, partial [Magnetococcales bacterium]|nr:DUF1538 family protein [Magnetococcales bacterium]